MNEYGVFANIVAIAGCLSAAAAALRLAWMKRSNWQPPEEEVPDAVARIAALFSMIVIAILYAFGAKRLGLEGLAVLSLASFAVAITFLCLTIFVNYSRSFIRKDLGQRVLGGFRLTTEARSIRQQHNLSEQQMFDDGQWDKDLVWTKSSQALAMVLSTLSFIGLIACGTTAIATAANLVALAMSSGTNA